MGSVPTTYVQERIRQRTAGCTHLVRFPGVQSLGFAAKRLTVCHPHHFVVLADDKVLAVSETGLRCLEEGGHLGHFTHVYQGGE